ncbi:MAG: SDR family oxidoreductase [Rhizobiaceae bacterium]|nr:SDR family oxidoreductase [Rhizobiaceae bacterium]MCV0404937.1 SDR family oxidoreductase [Rhizobiaceae bacterium]
MAQQSTHPLPARIDMSGREVMITGAASGIGQQTALVIAGLGANLVLVDIQPTSETLSLLGETAGRVVTRQGDLADDAFVDRLVAEGPYYSLAHCAAIFRAPEGMASGEDFDRVMRVNVRAPLQLASGVIEGMAERGEGYVVLVGSAAGRHGGIMTENSEPSYAEYAASKGGLHTLVKWLARRAVKSNVIVNGIAPGLVVTPLNKGMYFDPAVMFMPLGRAGRPDELAWPIALMCTPAASFICGVVVDVNGGSYVA